MSTCVCMYISVIGSVCFKLSAQCDPTASENLLPLHHLDVDGGRATSNNFCKILKPTTITQTLGHD